MTTKQKIMASIWVPLVSIYYLMVTIGPLFMNIPPLGHMNELRSLNHIFIVGALLWIPTLVICLVFENYQLKNDMEKPPISKILLIEAAICTVTIWLPIIYLIPFKEVVICSEIAILLSITARWGYLKWRKIC